MIKSPDHLPRYRICWERRQNVPIIPFHKGYDVFKSLDDARRYVNDLNARYPFLVHWVQQDVAVSPPSSP